MASPFSHDLQVMLTGTQLEQDTVKKARRLVSVKSYCDIMLDFGTLC